MIDGLECIFIKTTPIENVLAEAEHTEAWLEEMLEEPTDTTDTVDMEQFIFTNEGQDTTTEPRGRA